MSHLQSYLEPTPVDDNNMFGEGPVNFSDDDKNNEESDDDNVVSGNDEGNEGPYLSGYDKQYHNDNYDDNSEGNSNDDDDETPLRQREEARRARNL